MSKATFHGKDGSQDEIVAAINQWSCQECGKTEKATAHQKRQKYCSYACMANAYKSDLIGAKNPNFRAASVKTCQKCAATFDSYNKTRKYCSAKCYSDSKREGNTKAKNAKLDQRKFNRSTPLRFRQQTLGLVFSNYKPRPRAKFFSDCHKCGKQFRHPPSSKKQFCSKDCFVASGGPVRAGAASKLAVMHYGAKKDANHKEIFGIISGLVPARDLSSAGQGIPDGIAWINGGWHLFDIKNPKTSYGKKGLNKLQKIWADDWRGGPVYLIYTNEEAVQFCSGEFAALKRFPEIKVNESTP
jgi:hypothetical protein